VRGNWQKIGIAIETALRNVSLADLVPGKRRPTEIPSVTQPVEGPGVEP
jgi:DNA-binding IscR family transcriptional regulator